MHEEQGYKTQNNDSGDYDAVLPSDRERYERYIRKGHDEAEEAKFFLT
jgi:hypothetical protein